MRQNLSLLKCKLSFSRCFNYPVSFWLPEPCLSSNHCRPNCRHLMELSIFPINDKPQILAFPQYSYIWRICFLFLKILFPFFKWCLLTSIGSADLIRIGSESGIPKPGAQSDSEFLDGHSGQWFLQYDELPIKGFCHCLWNINLMWLSISLAFTPSRCSVKMNVIIIHCKLSFW